MPASALYEDFSDQAVETSASKPAEDKPQTNTTEVHRAGFDDGYKEGWIDAQAAVQSETSEISAEIATSLQEAGFAYFEARQHIFNSMRPLLTAMVEQVVPALAKETLAHKIVEHVQTIAQKTEPPMHILCAPECVDQIKAVIEKYVDFPMEVRGEDTLTASQATLQFSDGQTSIDLDAVVAELKEAVTNFYDLNQQEERAHA